LQSSDIVITSIHRATFNKVADPTFATCGNTAVVRRHTPALITTIITTD
jgi:hypothetical protein